VHRKRNDSDKLNLGKNNSESNSFSEEYEDSLDEVEPEEKEVEQPAEE
jgi:hypothetical protein